MRVFQSCFVDDAKIPFPHAIDTIGAFELFHVQRRYVTLYDQRDDPLNLTPLLRRQLTEKVLNPIRHRSKLFKPRKELFRRYAVLMELREIDDGLPTTLIDGADLEDRLGPFHHQKRMALPDPLLIDLHVLSQLLESDVRFHII